MKNKKYKPEYVQTVFDLGKTTSRNSMDFVAAHLNVSKYYLTKWCKEHPELRDAIVSGKKAFWHF